MSNTLPTEKKKPGRKSETPAQKLARLEQDIAAARQAVALAETRKLATIGSAVLAEAEDNPSFMKQLRELLQKWVTSKTGQADIAGLIATAKNEPASPAR